MKLINLITFFTFFTLHTQAQTIHKSTINKNFGWLTYQKKNKSAKKIIDSKKTLGLSEHDDLSLLAVTEDHLGFKHYKYQQKYKAVPIEGAIYLMHEKNGQVELSNGKLVHQLDMDVIPSLKPEAAVKLAMNHIPSQLYAWQQASESANSKLQKNEAHPYYPKASLVIVDPHLSNSSSNYRLAYKCNIYSLKPLVKKMVFVDAHNGEIITTLNQIHQCNKSSVEVNTNYYSRQQIPVCEENETYVLKNEAPANIEVWDYKTDTLIMDTTNLAANEVMWATEKAFKYFYEEHNRPFPDVDSVTISKVNSSFNNDIYGAYYLEGIGVVYGKGDGTKRGTLTSADIVGHELAHGVVKFSANLYDRYQSGALNESFADIFGEMIEAACKTDGSNDWIIGKEVTIEPSGGLRNMKNPKEKQHPDTYFAEYWVASDSTLSCYANDNCGIHTNSSIQNYWFYLLSEGGNGTNDLGFSYDVKGISKAKAAQIAYRNLTTYLTPTAQYEDAKRGSIQAAIDLFGDHSTEVKQTINAWSAVGLAYSKTEVDSLVLVSLYKATKGENWEIKWDLTTSMKNWYGLTLNEHGRVVQIDLSGNQLAGFLPTDLGNLTALTYLNLSNNNIGKIIPFELGNLQNLEYLYLNRNQLVDAIPEQLSNLKNLTALALSYNNLVGRLPEEISHLKKLKYLWLNNNQLEGNFPANFGHLKNLTTLYLNNNNLRGCYGANLLNLCNQLQSSDNACLSNGNNFYRTWEDFCKTENACPQTPLPACRQSDSLALLALHQATDGANWNRKWSTSRPLNFWEDVFFNEEGCVNKLFLANNNLTGIIPPELGNLKFLKYLWLNNNHLEAKIPEALCNLNELEYLWLNHNNLRGNIPVGFGEMQKLNTLGLNNNQLDGCYENLSPLCTRLSSNLYNQSKSISEGNNFYTAWDVFCNQEVATCACHKSDSLTLIKLYDATKGHNWKTPWNLNEAIDNWYGVSLNENGCVHELNLNNNRLSGTIPAALGDLNELNHLNLSNNDLSSGIPVELGKLDHLLSLNLTNNYLTGSLPADLVYLNQLSHLSLGKNQLNDAIFKELVKLRNLKVLDLSSNDFIINVIPDEIGGFNELEILDLSFNDFTGKIPASVGNLSQLKELKLSGNQLSEIPPALGNLSELTLLYLTSNELTKIPEDFYQLKKLQTLDISFNFLDEGLSPQFGQLTNLEHLSLQFNKLTRAMPTEFGNLINLVELNLSDNILTGNLPASIGDLENLKSLLLRRNRIGGNLPTEIGQLQKIEELDLSLNNLSGLIPPEIGNLSLIETLDLSSNYLLSGNLPAEISNLKNLNVIDVSLNNLSGCFNDSLKTLCELPINDRNINYGNNFNTSWGDFCYADELVCAQLPQLACRKNDSLTLVALYQATNGANWSDPWNLTKPLETWDRVTLNESGCVSSLTLFSKNLVGSIPPELGNLKSLTKLELRGNALIGTIPTELGKLNKLNELDLSMNQLSDPIPDSLANLTNLTTLNLSLNNLTGNIPESIESLVNLNKLDLSDNLLSGNIPTSLSNLQKLDQLDLSYNQLIGSIPKALGFLSDLTSLSLTNNQLSGNIPTELSYLNKLSTLKLNHNQLSGSIPKTLSDLTQLGIFLLNDNELNGNIPAELGNLCELWALDLSANQLTGEIPKELAKLHQLFSLSINKNVLSGCFYNDLDIWCDQLYPPTFNAIRDIDRGNNFEASWIDFCNDQKGVCKPTPQKPCRQNDSLALVQFYQTTKGDDWIKPWNLNEPMENWEGIRMNKSGCVEVIALNNNNLQGEIPAAMANMQNLEWIELSGNQLFGGIPEELAALQNLKALILSENQLSGDISKELGELYNLEFLILDNNQFNGSIPMEIGNLTKLFQLHLHNNQLSGNIPNPLGDLYLLTELRLHTNHLTGIIPPEFKNLYSLNLLQIYDNELSGCYKNLSILCDQLLPQFFNPNIDSSEGNQNISAGNNFDVSWDYFCFSGEATCASFSQQECRKGDSLNLTVLHQTCNGENWFNTWNLEEPMHTWHGLSLNEFGCVTDLDLSKNNLSGTLPVEIGALKHLKNLYLYANQLSGSIPKELGQLNQLNAIGISDNSFTGEIPAELSNLPKLTFLNLSNNMLSGNIPVELGQLYQLVTLSLSNNQLNGSIPAQLGDLANLNSLWLNDNNLSGEIPETIGQLKQLTQLYLDKNTITGPIPPALANLIELSHLYLSDNYLTGEIPPGFGQLCNLTELSLFFNELEGEIPSELGSLTKLELLHLAFNRLSGSIPNRLTRLYNLKDLFMSYNNLEGEIPSDMHGMENLIYLSLDNNQLTGELPEQLGNLPNLTLLEIANNQLSGCFKDSFLTLCNQLTSTLFDGHADINEGNNFITGWDSFCNSGICVPPQTFTCAESDSLALLALYEATNGAGWINKWNLNQPIETWFGLTFDENACLAEIDLSSNNLTGTIPTEIGNLNQLSRLYLYNNALSGNIPAEIGNLFQLTDLYLGNNQLEGNLPETLVNLSKLGVLYVSFNQLSGEIPATLANLSNLFFLSLSDNQFTGSLPGTLGNLNNLTLLEVSYNQLEGCFSDSLAVLCEQLTSSLFDGNDDISAGNNFEDDWENFCSNGYCSKTSTLPCRNRDSLALLTLYNTTGGINWIQNWNINEPMHTWFGVSLNTNGCVTKLDLTNNQLKGKLPADLANLSQLEELYLDRNELTGNIPTELSNLSELSVLYLANNALTGTIPYQLGNLIKLIDLYLSNNQLSGELPTEIGNLEQLIFLSAAGNQLSGNIPPSFANMSKLILLEIANNQLSGCYDTNLSVLCNQLTSSLFDGNADISTGNNFEVSWDDFCTNGTCNTLPQLACRKEDSLALLKLYHNTGGLNWTQPWDITQSINNWYGLTLNGNGCVTKLELPENNLTGTIPAELGTLNSLTDLKLDKNNLTGNIPSALSNLTMLENLNLSSNLLSGGLPKELGNLDKLTILSLSFNNLSGSLPEEFGNLSSLAGLFLTFNQLNGEIPVTFGNLNNLSFCFLGYNNLSGDIPAALANLNELIALSINDNQLEGCYDEQLKSLCSQLNSQFFLGNADISDGNNFTAGWEDFCATDAGKCACASSLNLTDADIVNDHIFQAENTIEFSGHIDKSQNILFKAGESVELKREVLIEKVDISIEACEE